MHCILLSVLCTFSKINSVRCLFSKFYSKMRGTPKKPDQNNGQDDMQSGPKYLEQLEEIKQNWTGIENFSICV